MPLRNLILRFVSKDTALKMEEESRRWMMVCKGCAREISIWDIGGIRYKGSTNSKTASLLKCPTCDKRTWHTLVKRESVAL